MEKLPKKEEKLLLKRLGPGKGKRESLQFAQLAPKLYLIVSITPFSFPGLSPFIDFSYLSGKFFIMHLVPQYDLSANSKKHREFALKALEKAKKIKRKVVFLKQGISGNDLVFENGEMKIQKVFSKKEKTKTKPKSDKLVINTPTFSCGKWHLTKYKNGFIYKRKYATKKEAEANMNTFKKLFKKKYADYAKEKGIE